VKVSIVMPVFNEKETIREILAQVRTVGLASQIIVVDDCSTDGTREVLQDEAARDQTITLVLHDRNRGKGASVRSGIEQVTGDIVIIQDADLEYDPRDYPTLIRPIQEGRVKVVYGSRFLGPRKDMLFWHMLGNMLLTLMTNILYDSTLSDMETCYKAMRADVAKSLNIKSDRWGLILRSRPRCSGAAIASLRCPSRTMGANTMRARKSPGAMVRRVVDAAQVSLRRLITPLVLCLVAFGLR